MTGYFEEFCGRIKRDGASAVIHNPVVVNHTGVYRMTYVPFEYANTQARLILVSSTPGYTHHKLACKLTAQLLTQKAGEIVILRENKRQAELGGGTIRLNLIRMLDHFRIGHRFGLSDASALWDHGFCHLQPVALLPLSTTKRGIPFAGGLPEILSVPMLAQAFQSLFMARLRLIHPDAVYVALGQCAWSGLQHAVSQGFVRQDQLVGMLPSPARSGSTLDYFLRNLSLGQMAELKLRRHHIEWLDAAHAGITASLERLWPEHVTFPQNYPQDSGIENGLFNIKKISRPISSPR